MIKAKGDEVHHKCFPSEGMANDFCPPTRAEVFFGRSESGDGTGWKARATDFHAAYALPGADQ
jgi:hypothetical protein